MAGFLTGCGNKLCAIAEQCCRGLTQKRLETEKPAVKPAVKRAMKRALRLGCGLVLLLWLCVRPAEAATHCRSSAAQALPSLEKISPHLWRVAAITGEPNADNGGLTSQLLVATEGQKVWLAGTGPTPAFAQALACTIRRVLGRRVTDVINTRAAPELVMGNSAFSTARLWALPPVISAMHARCLQCQTRLKARIGAAGASLVPGTIRVATRPITASPPGLPEPFFLGPFEWRALLRAPGEYALVLRHRQDRLVLAQGLLWPGDVPDLQDTQIETLTASWQQLFDFAGDDALLGEQGNLASASDLRLHTDYLAQLRAAVWAALQSGQSFDPASDILALPGFQGLPSYSLRHPLNVQRVWRELEPKIFDAPD